MVRGARRADHRPRSRARPLRARCAARPRAPAGVSTGSRRRSRRTSTRSRSKQQPPFPGDLAMEQRLAALMRWNALAMVMRANRAESGGSAELGGHIASYASAADIFEVGFNHFFRARGEAPTGDQPGGPITSGRGPAQPGFLGDLVFFQPHSAPGVYARAFLEGRLSADDLAALSPGAGCAGARRARPDVVSASAADARLLAVPDRLDGDRPDQCDLPGALHALSAASRPARGGERAETASRLGLFRRRRDGRARVDRRALAGRARAARQLHLRHQLQPAAARRAGARQRPDHRRARVAVRRRRLARRQVPVELGLGRAVRARPRPRADARIRADRRRPVPDALGEGRRLQPRGLLRPERGAEGARRRPARRGHRSPPSRRPRRGQDPRRVRRRGGAHGPADGRPRQDHEGLRDGRGGAGPDDDAPGEEARQRRPARLPRPLRAADERRRHAVARLLQAGRRQRRDALPAEPPARPGRVAAGAAQRLPGAVGARARRPRPRSRSTPTARR